MGMKRLVMFGLFMLLVVSFVSADSCSIQSSCNANNIVMKLSATTNAHGELWNQANYNQYLCCDFTGIHTDNGVNKILGLSSPTNAHAEIPSLNNYGTDVYFGNLLCTSNPTTCLTGYTIQMVSLSATTNAHIGAFADYSTKICCKQNEYCGDGVQQDGEVCDDGVNNGGLGFCYSDCSGIMGDGIINGPIEGIDPNGDIDGDGIPNGIDPDMDGDGIPNGIDPDMDGDGIIDTPIEECDDGNLVNGDGCSITGQLETEIFWIDKSGNKIGNDINGSVIETHVGETIKLIWNNTGLSPSTTFEIYENDLIGSDYITTINGIFSSEGNGIVTGEWTITQEDYEKTEAGDVNEFFFKINSEESNYLTILPMDHTEWCMNYEEEAGCASCDYSGCNAAANSVNIKVFEAFPEQWGDTRCGNTVEVSGSNCSFIVDCFCEWDDSAENCGYEWEMAADNCETAYPSIGKCTYQEDTADTCEDGFLEYSWDGIWKWGANNGYSQYTDGPSPNEGDYVLDGTTYYYDPNKISAKCIGGNNVVSCPAQIQLPFFGFYNLIGTLLFIGMIYGLLIKRED